VKGVSTYKSQAARDAQATNYGSESYWRSLDESAERAAAFFRARGDNESAERMFTRSLSEALADNDGD